jgi:hypothetical protein
LQAAQRFSPTIEASVYLLISEALTNVVKHTSAASPRVRIAAAAGQLSVEVSDNGVAAVHIPSGDVFRAQIGRGRWRRLGDADVLVELPRNEIPGAPPFFGVRAQRKSPSRRGSWG